ncbi:MAG: glucose-1-phosphate adenylyltransferase [Gammaproteobacteria bacterium]|nr:MAG: glucose-1-phosphate adenylyltransferase [Gammaproteobacteria bacterium]
MIDSDVRFVSRITRRTLALVLAGGRGSRLMHLTNWRAKPAVPFGGKFRIIDFTLSNCINSGVRQIAVLTQYKAHSLLRHIQNGWGFLRGQFGEFIELLPAQQRIESSWYLGTADAVYQNLDIIRSHDPEYVLILAGDHVYKMDYGEMLAHHVENEADLTVGCVEVPVREAAGAFGVMSIENDRRIVGFEEKPAQPTPIPGKPDKALASMGIYAFNTEVLIDALLADADDKTSDHDFGKNVIPRMIRDKRVFAYPFGGRRGNYWRDVGTVDNYWRANLELVDVDPELNLYDEEWPIWTYQEQVPPAKFVFDEDARRGMAVNSMVSGGCIISGAVIRRSLLFTNVRVEQQSLVENSVILPEVRVGRNCTLRNCIIDKGCVIPDGSQVGVDLEADARRFYVTPGGVVLVVPEMLGIKRHQVR